MGRVGKNDCKNQVKVTIKKHASRLINIQPINALFIPIYEYSI